MKIIGVETIVPELTLTRRHVLCQVHTDEGLIGVGMTVDLRTVGVVHDLAEQFLIGADPLRIKERWHQIFDHTAYHGYAGAETRALSAFDIALWDLAGQSYGQPVNKLLGGPVRDRVPIYNTCGTFGAFSDGRRSADEPVALCEELLAEGISCVKWGPFDRYARESNGQRISRRQLREGVERIEQVAEAFDGRMEIMIELHGLWTPSGAAMIAEALDGLPVPWIEDPIAQDDAEGWAWLRARSPIPVAGGERLQTRFQLRRLIENGGVDIVISDVTWSGGITEAVRTADLAHLHGVSFATHGNSGPVNLWSSAHVLTSAVNAYAAETVRAYHHPEHGYYHTLAEGPAILDGGHVTAPTAPGLGIRLLSDFPVVERRVTGTLAS